MYIRQYLISYGIVGSPGVSDPAEFAQYAANTNVYAQRALASCTHIRVEPDYTTNKPSGYDRQS